MLPPPAREFNSREDLLSWVKGWAEDQGYAVVIGRSRPNRLWIKCDRGGEYSGKHLIDPDNRKRKRKESRLTGCPFKIKANMKKDKIWRLHTEIEEHNHGPSEDLSVHPSLRRMTDDQTRVVNDMTEAGNTPAETMVELQRRWPGIKVLRRDIYNARKKYKSDKEQTEQGQVVEDQPHYYEDPNGKMPGPTRTGRWEWLEPGDEVKRKKRKTTSIGVPSVQSNIAPELRDTNTMPSFHTHSIARQSSNLGPSLQNMQARQPQMPMSTHQQLLDASLQSADVSFENATMPSPQRMRQFVAAQAQVAPMTRSNMHRASAVPDGVLHSQGQRLPHAPDNNAMMAAAQMMNGNPAAAAAVPKTLPSSQAFMSRIERMEQEQREQKNVLAQILNVVKGVASGAGNANAGMSR
jgi:hypothetical protein